MKKIKMWFSVLLAFVVFHSTITIFYNLPITPFKSPFNKVINIYMNPLFTQTWTLFAPNPVSTNIGVEVKFSYENNKKTEWISFSDTVLEQSQRSFFSHYQFYKGALTQMDNDMKEASVKIMNQLEDEGNKELLDKLKSKEYFDKDGSKYVNGLIEEDEVKKFFQENLTVNSAYGMIYDYYSNHFSEITDMQVRVVSEIFSEYGKSQETKYEFFFLPKIEIKKLIKNKRI